MVRRVIASILLGLTALVVAAPVASADGGELPVAAAHPPRCC